MSASAAQAMTASLESAASSSGGSKFGAGVSLAASGLIATNTVMGGADAHVTGSTLTIGGDVTVQAVNNAALEAHLVNATSSGAEAIGVTLAFNTLGWEPQNILFNTIDALIGDPAIADAFGADQASGATAYLEDTTVDATGLLTVSADSAAQLERGHRQHLGFAGLGLGRCDGAFLWCGSGAEQEFERGRGVHRLERHLYGCEDDQRRCRGDGQRDRCFGARRDAGPELGFLDL